MNLSARDTYLETQVNTATPQRLRLMLIEGALRQAQAAQTAWEARQSEEAGEALTRCRDIISELLAGITPGDTAVVRQTLGIYAYLFSALTEVQQSRDPHQLAGIIRVLDEERQTWQEVCLALPHRVVAATEPASTEEVAPQRVAATFQPSYVGAFAPSTAALESLSIEA
jgi:flagellar secretion chaperone FliS